MPGPRVFVLVDDPALRKRLTQELRSSGLSVYDGCSHGVRPRAVQRFKPDVLVIDLGEAGYGGDTPWRARPVFDALWPQEPILIALDRLASRESGDRRQRLRPHATLEGSIEISRVAIEVQRQLAGRRSATNKATQSRFKVARKAA